FNDVALALAPCASGQEVIAWLDAVLEPYCGLGAYGREDQISYRILGGEIAQQRTTATAMPIALLTIAAVLLHMVMVRLVDTQRPEIAILKAFGYANRLVAAHYLAFGVLAVAVGAVAGTVLGFWLGSAYTELYSQYFRFPALQ